MIRKKNKSKNIHISLFLGLGSLYWVPFSYHDGSREEVLDALKHTPYKTQQISDTIPYRRWPCGHHHTALQVRDEIKQAFLSQGLSGRAIWDKGYRRQRLICKCLKSSHEDWPLPNSENPKDNNNARKRGQFFGESVFVTEAWEIWSLVFTPVWRFLSMWKCPIVVLCNAHPIQW